MLVVTAILTVICALLSVAAAYMIFQAGQAKQSHKQQLRAIQQRLAEKEANPNSPRPSHSVASKTLATTRNSRLDQTLSRIRNASASTSSKAPNKQQSNTQQKH